VDLRESIAGKVLKERCSKQFNLLEQVATAVMLIESNTTNATKCFRFAHQCKNLAEEVEWFIARFKILAGMYWLHAH
jgi:hypothetical protein